MLEGLPVGKSLDWVELDFADEIVVPDDAWYDWDATTQTFITVEEAGMSGLTASNKSFLTILLTCLKLFNGTMVDNSRSLTCCLASSLL